MRFRKMNGRRTVLTSVGLLALAVAVVLGFVLQPGPHFARTQVVGTIGLFYGVAIGILFLSLRPNREAVRAGSLSHELGTSDGTTDHQKEKKMSLRNRFKNSRVQRNFGLLALALGGITRLFLHPTAFIVPSVFDGIVGFFYGAAIGALLLSLRKGQSVCARTSQEA